MKVLVVGKGGREHAICWKLSQSRGIKKIYAAPGNAGISYIGECVDIQVDDLKGLADFAQKNKVDLTVVGPEMPLTIGIVDEFESRGLKIFGPSKEASLIEGSKAFAKEFMKKYHIPTASFKIFSKHFDVLDFVKSAGYPLVIKADGLAAGKGAVVCNDVDEACRAVEKIMVQKVFGAAGMKLVVEEYLEGEEVTVMAFTDGKNIVPMVSSQDHKRIYNGDRGPNTGGMGAYAPTNVISSMIMKTIYEEILEPTIRGLAAEDRTYKGVLYFGLMLSKKDVKVLEYNCRFGDPETQVVLPLLESDLAEIFINITEGYLNIDKIKWTDKYAVSVVLASKGYPGKYETNKVIKGLEKVTENGGIVFHAGTRRDDGKIISNGGRVLNVTALGGSIKEAIKNVYELVDMIEFENKYFRHDIGWRAQKGVNDY
ncbi:MAG: phosphoribosylamine--glycine ligase [candidate division Zixibacteria bacterium 4484_95]|nr:MAG: phosphoribosylamine--glycine ligase [candidate division Zixibacteria bacterium 4484_95]